jgi:KDO2-lipid IV(A) lauroyltransferase
MYYVTFGLLWLFSRLPFPILYLISDGVYGLLFYVFRYRRDVVMNNLQIAFPEKTETERQNIAKQFYRNLSDAFMESLKFITIRKKQVLQRSSSDLELLNKLLVQGKNIHLMAGHQFNWEYGNYQLSMHLPVPFVGIYMPIQNKHLNRIFYNFRSRYGAVLISASEFKNKEHEVFSRQYTFGLAADQNPGDPSNGYWMNFFGRPVPFVTGPGKGAVKNNTAVVLVAFQKIKRGHYHFHPILIAENGSQYTPHQLTLLYKKVLEEVIRKDPANYLWSHRRWKYEWKPEYGELLQ